MHCPIGIMVKDFKEDKKKKEFPNVSKVAVIWFPGAYIRSSSGNNLTFSDAPSVDRYMLGLFPSLVSFKNISVLMLCVYKRIKRLYNYIRASPFRLYISMARSPPNGMRASSSSRLCTSSYGEKGEMMSFTLPRGANATATGRESTCRRCIRPVGPACPVLGETTQVRSALFLFLRRRFCCCCVIVKNNNIGAITGKYRQGQQGGLSMRS
jgi:hypothetical protein